MGVVNTPPAGGNRGHGDAGLPHGKAEGALLQRCLEDVGFQHKAKAVPRLYHLHQGAEVAQGEGDVGGDMVYLA